MSKSFTFKLFLLTGMLLIGNSTSLWSQSANEVNAQAVLSQTNQAFFIENKGQWAEEVFYKMSIGGLDAWITKSGVVYDFYLNEEVAAEEMSTVSLGKDQKPEKAFQRKGQVISVELNNPNPATLQTNGAQENFYNYFLGNDPSKWTTQVALFQEIKLANIFDHIDLKYYFDQGYLRYDYIVKPGGDPADIQFEIKGCENYFVNYLGELVLKTRFGIVKQKQLELYQIINNEKVTVLGAFAKTAMGIKFNVGEYDKTKDLIIDPIVWSTFIGGALEDVANDIALDQANNIYITGYIQSSSFPTTNGAYDDSFNEGEEDVFLSKINANGNSLAFSTFIGGTTSDKAEGLNLDNAGNIYITGYTNSADFPITAGAFQETRTGSNDVFVTKLSPDGSALGYSTLLGGGSFEFGHDIIVDELNNAYVTGYTNSTDFPITSGAFSTTSSGSYDVYVSKLNASGSALIYSTYLGGTGEDRAFGIALDNSKNAYVTGYTRNGSTFPTTAGAYQTTPFSQSEIYVSKLNTDATALVYSTLIVGNNNDVGGGLIVDDSGHAYVYGFTSSSDFVTTPNAFGESYGGSTDGYILKLNPTGSDLVFSSYLGGAARDLIIGLTLNENQEIYLTGVTESNDFPTSTAAYDLSYNGNEDLFITKMNADASVVLYSSFMGGAGDDKALAIMLDDAEEIYIAGQTRSFDYPISEGSFDQTQNGSLDAFVTKLNINAPPCLSDGITFTTQDQIDAFPSNYPGCTTIAGNVTIDESSSGNITNLDGLSQIEHIGGNLYFDGNGGITSIAGLSNLSSIGGFLRFHYISGLNDLSGLENLTTIGGGLTINNSSFTNLTGLNALSSIGGGLSIYDNLLFNLSGLEMLTSIGGDLAIYSHEILMNISALGNLNSIGGSIYIVQNSGLNSLQGLQNIDPTTIKSTSSLEDLVIEDNQSLFDCAVESICTLLQTPNTTIKIQQNALHCNSQLEIEQICLPVNPTLDLTCPEDIAMTIPTGQTSIPVTWDDPVPTTNCNLGQSIVLAQTEGASSGSDFGIGTHTISYEAIDDCEQLEICSFTISLSQQQGTNDCPLDIPGFDKLGEYNGHGYYISDNKKRWEDAKIIAEELGGHLASIADQAENDFLQSLLMDVGEMAYIGYSDAATEGTGAWANGNPVNLDLSFNNNSENDYAVMNYWAGTWGMNNKWVSKKYIMEIDCANYNGVMLSIDCPADINLTTGTGSAIANWDAVTATTTCASSNLVTINQIVGMPSGAEFALGTHTITYEATDDCDQVKTCSFTITVSAITPTGSLSLSCPDDIEITLPAGENTEIVSWNEPTASTTCNLSEVVTLTQTMGPASGAGFSTGTHTISYEATDDCNNTETCSFTITILETVPEACSTTLPGYDKLGEYNGHGYYISEEKKRWEDAKIIAEELGGHLASIENQEENNFLQAMLQEIGEMAYIGYTDAGVEGTGAWASGESVNLDLSFNNNSENDYAVMNYWAGTWGMNNKWVKKRYILELDCAATSQDFVTISCQDDIYMTTSTGSATVNWDEAIATTTCTANNAVTINQIAGLPSGSNFDIGSYTITYEATDLCDNVAICSFIVTVEDQGTGNCIPNINGFTKIGEYEGHGYYISEDKENWNDAKVLAENLGGYLAVMNSQDENNYLQYNLDEQVIIGYNDQNLEGVGAWANGDPVSLDLSFNNNSENDFAVMNYWAGTWEMNNKWVKKRFVVELDCIINRLQEETTKFTDAFNLKVNPNPAKNFLQLKMESSVSQNVVIELFSVDGKQLYRTKKDLQKGINEMILSIEGLSKGFFLLRIAGNDFEETRKLIKE